MTVSPIDVIARSEAFESAAADQQLRPWEWAFIHAVDGRMQLHEVAVKCGLALDTATDIVLEQTRAGLLRVVTMTLDGYRHWSGIVTPIPEPPAQAAVAPATAVEPAQAPAEPHEPPVSIPAPIHQDSFVTEPSTTEPSITESAPSETTVESPTVAAIEHAPAAIEPTLAVATDHVASEPVAYEPSAHEASAPDPFANEPFAHETLAHEALAHEPPIHDAPPPDPFANEPFAHETLAHDALAHEPATHESPQPDPFANEPFAHETHAHDALAHEPPTHESPRPDPFANEPFAHETLAHEAPPPDPFANEPFAHETAAAADVPPAAKSVSISFDSFDALDSHESPHAALEPFSVAPSEPAYTAPVARLPEPPLPEPSHDAISLSFEPGDTTALDTLPTFPSTSGVSLSFDTKTAPYPTFEPADHALPVPAPPAAEPENTGPISLSFSADGFPILTPVAEPAATIAEPTPQSAAEVAPQAPAATPQPGTPTKKGPNGESGDVVGSLIARVLSIRIK
jgi:hypothetical protein